MSDLEAPPFMVPHNHVYGQNLSPSHVEHHDQVDAYKALCERYRSALEKVAEHPCEGCEGNHQERSYLLLRAKNIASEALQPEGEK